MRSEGEQEVRSEGEQEVRKRAVRGEMDRRDRVRASVAIGVLTCLGHPLGVPAAAVAQAADVQQPVVLQYPASIRSAGFNGAGVALVGNAGAVFFNPAGLATIRHVAVEGALQSGPFAGVLSTAALAWRLGQFDLGFGVNYFDFDNSPGPTGGFTTPAGTPVDARMGNVIALLSALRDEIRDVIVDIDMADSNVLVLAWGCRPRPGPVSLQLRERAGTRRIKPMDCPEVAHPGDR